MISKDLSTLRRIVWEGRTVFPRGCCGGRKKKSSLRSVYLVDLEHVGFMISTDIPDRLRRFEIPGRVTLMEGNGELLKFEVTTDSSTGEIYLNGAHVSDFQKKCAPPLVFTSQFSRFRPGQAIRGGIPNIFPWFGEREGVPRH